MTLSRLSVVALVCLIALISVHEAQANPAREWKKPLYVRLPEATRQVVLDTTEPGAWLDSQGIADGRVTPLGDKSLVEFAMGDDEWAQKSEQLCQGVATCEASACQTIQMSSSIGGVEDVEKVKARIVKNEQTLKPLEPGEVGQTCTSPIAFPLDPGNAGTSLNLDLRPLQSLASASAEAKAVRNSSDSSVRDTGVVDGQGSPQGNPGSSPQVTAEGSPQVTPEGSTAGSSNPPTDGGSGAATTDGSPASQSVDAASQDAAGTTGGQENAGTGQQEAGAGAEEGAQSATEGGSAYAQSYAEPALAFQMDVSQSFSGVTRFRADDLPADTTDYTLVVGEGCRSVRIPLDSVIPAKMPGLIVALVAQDAALPVAADYGLNLLERNVLASTGETMVVYDIGSQSLANYARILTSVRMDPRVTSAQEDFIFTTAAVEYSDPYAAFSYGPERTGARALHGVTVGNGQTVAVIDTGVALEHPEFVERVEGLDFTGEGFSPDAHGTAVAGIIAAAADNAQGIYGVAPNTRILALKACQPVEAGGLRAKCRSSALVRALDAAILREVEIINMSLAGPPDDLLNKFVEQAAAKGALVIAGAGNGGSHAKPAYPAAIESVLAVTAVDIEDGVYREANTGAYIDVAAPGVDIATPSPNGVDYPFSSGTSWAAAHVSGIAVLIKDLLPTLTAAELGVLLSVHAKDLGSAGRDPVFGHGLVDACSTAASVTADAVLCPGSQLMDPANNELGGAQ